MNEDAYREYVMARMDRLRRTAYLLCHADGTTVALITDDGNEHNTRVKSLDEPVFTHDQLVRMGTDPRWKL